MKKQPMTLDSMTGLDGKPDDAPETPVKLGRFVDIFGTEHEIKCILGNGRSTAMCSYHVEVLRADAMDNRRLIRLQEPTTNGVQEVWVESSRLS